LTLEDQNKLYEQAKPILASGQKLMGSIAFYEPKLKEMFQKAKAEGDVDVEAEKRRAAEQERTSNSNQAKQKQGIFHKLGNMLKGTDDVSSNLAQRYARKDMGLGKTPSSGNKSNTGNNMGQMAFMNNPFAMMYMMQMMGMMNPMNMMNMMQGNMNQKDNDSGPDVGKMNLFEKRKMQAAAQNAEKEYAREIKKTRDDLLRTWKTKNKAEAVAEAKDLGFDWDELQMDDYGHSKGLTDD